MTPALTAYRWLTAALEPLLPLLLRRRAQRGREDPARLAERLARADDARPPGWLVWLHGASVGEGLSLLPLVEALARAAPDATLLVTSGTVTSAALLSRRLPPGALHRFAPLDGPGAARRFVDLWRPDLAVFAESEVWPNLLREVRRAGGRTALVSARLSRASLDGWGRAPGAAREVFGGYDLVLAQDDATAAALGRLGARDDGRLNLKLAGGALPVDEEALAALGAGAAGRPVLLAASTHPGEEAAVLDAFLELVDRADAPLLVLAPRHPHRGAEIEALVAGRGFGVTRQGAGQAFGGASVHVADAMGELGPWFRLAASAYVGGGLLPGVGGHNPLEPARLRAPVAIGPHRANWEDVHRLLGDSVVTVADAPALAGAWRRDLDDPAAARARADRAAARLRREDAAVADAADRLAALLLTGSAGGAAGAAVKPATPRWWYVREGAPAPVLRALLRPASWVWAGVTARRIARATPADVGVPVICVGNLTVGGAGKTPVVRALLAHLRARGIDAHGLSRGHGGSDRGPRRVRPDDPAGEVGDEPVMLAGDGPFWIARDRTAGARAAAADGARVVVLDDGHQNPSLAKALSLLVVDGETREGEWPFGDGSVFPSGPMREPLAAGLARADAVVLLLPADLPEPEPELVAVFGRLPVLVARLEPAAPPPPGPQFAFAGVGKPWKVERSLRAAGCDLVDFASWPDHHPYAEADLRVMAGRASALGAGLLTTEKDAARLPPAWRARVAVWPVCARFEDEPALDALLRTAVP